MAAREGDEAGLADARAKLIAVVQRVGTKLIAAVQRAATRQDLFAVGRRSADLPAVWKLEPTAMLALSKRLGAKSKGHRRADALVPAWPLRASSEVFLDMVAEKPVSAREIWRLLDDVAWWESIRDGRPIVVGNTGQGWGANAAALKLWELSHRSPGLRADLRWLVGKALTDDSSQVEAAIVGNFQRAHVEDLDIFAILRDNDAKRLLRVAIESSTTPREFLVRSGVPSAISLAAEASMMSVWLFLKDPVAREAWLIRCLVDLSQPDRNLAVTTLLAEITDANLAHLSALRQALHDWYIADVSDHTGLGGAARARMAAWAGLFRWDTFLDFTERRFGRTIDDLGHLQSLGNDVSRQERVARGALGRMAFWRNYAARISDLRFYVPENSDLQLFMGVEGASAEWVELRPKSEIRLTVLLGTFLIRVPLDSGAPIECTRVSEEASRSYKAARAEAEKNNKVEFEIRAEHEWQSQLFHRLKRLGILPNDGLLAFEGVPRRILDKSGMPTVTKVPAPGSGKWASQNPRR